ncbi:FRG domain-containing protein [Aeromonas hydrophila]|uniref:FRG domain-containing protein n=1 Tax=Aeromonas hydrophila TaxID=644 RepID=UPI0038D0ADCC
MTKERNNEENQDKTHIQSISSFLDALRGLDDSDRFKREYFFRGHADINWKPIPSIYRNEKWIKNEEIMIKDLISKCPNEFINHKYTFQSLVKMQHYSLPTRLLDITTNPLVALYFACQPERVKNDDGVETEADGEVIIFCAFKDSIKYHDSDTVSIISNIAKRPKNFDLNEAPKSEKEIAAFNATHNIQLLLHDIRHEKPHFESKIERNHLESVVFVRPLLDNPRIIKQDGYFILFGISDKKTSPAKIREYCFPQKKMPQILIPADKKEVILNELEVLGISNDTIFPDIDNVAKFIKSKYLHDK